MGRKQKNLIEPLFCQDIACYFDLRIQLCTKAGRPTVSRLFSTLDLISL